MNVDSIRVFGKDSLYIGELPCGTIRYDKGMSMSKPLVLAHTRQSFRRFIETNHLRLHDFVYIHDPYQMRGVRGVFILLEGYEHNPNYGTPEQINTEIKAWIEGRDGNEVIRMPDNHNLWYYVSSLPLDRIQQKCVLQLMVLRDKRN